MSHTRRFRIFELNGLYMAVDEDTSRAIDDVVFDTVEDALMHVLLHGNLLGIENVNVACDHDRHNAPYARTMLTARMLRVSRP